MSIYVQGKTLKKEHLGKVIGKYSDNPGFEVIKLEGHYAFNFNGQKGEFNVQVSASEIDLYPQKPLVRVSKQDLEQARKDGPINKLVGHYSGKPVTINLAKGITSQVMFKSGWAKIGNQYEPVTVMLTWCEEYKNTPAQGSYFSGEHPLRIKEDTSPLLKDPVQIREQARKMGLRPNVKLDCLVDSMKYVGEKHWLGDDPQNDFEKQVLADLAKCFLKFRYAFNPKLVIFERAAIKTRNEEGDCVLEEVVLDEK